MVRRHSVSVFLATIFVCLINALSAAPADGPRSEPPWWNAAWRYRTCVTRSAPFRSNAPRPVEASIDFGLLLRQAGKPGTFDPASVRVIQSNEQGGMREIPFAMRREAGSAAGSERAYLAWRAEPAAGQAGRFDVYFNTVDQSTPAPRYDAAKLPPENLVENASFEDSQDDQFAGWTISPPALFRRGSCAGTTGKQSLKVVVDETTPAGTSRDAEVAQRFSVAEFAGQEMMFQCDLLAQRAAYGAPVTIELEQFRADGSRIAQYAIEPRWLTLELAQGQLVSLAQRGRFHPEAATVNVRIRFRCAVRDAVEGGYVSGEESYFTVCLDRIVVRPGERWSWPGESSRGFVQGALTGAPFNLGYAFTGLRRLAFNGASESTLTEGRYNPDRRSVHWAPQRGTMEFWMRSQRGTDNRDEMQVLFEGVAYGHRLQSRLAKSGRPGTRQLEWLIADSSGRSHHLAGPLDDSPDRWVHVAATWDLPRAHLQLFVDGKRVAQQGPGDAPWPLTMDPDDPNVRLGIGIMENDRRSLPMQAFLGGDRTCDPRFSAQAVLDEFRISDCVRYQQPFTPALTEFDVDPDTRVLLHFEHELDGVHAGDDQRVRGSLACELPPYEETVVLEAYDDAAVQRQLVTLRPRADEGEFERNRAESRLTVTRPWEDLPDPRRVALRPRQAEVLVESLADEQVLEVGGDYPPWMQSISFEHQYEASARTTLLPRWRANDRVVPLSFQDLAATLAPQAGSDEEKALAVFRYALETSNYYDADICETLSSSRHRPRVSYTLCRALNMFAFDQCGPLNYTLRKLLLAGGISSNDASGTHHQFEQAYYDGDFRLFDLSPRIYWLERDNQSVASRREFEEDLYLKLRQGSSVVSGLPGRVSRARFGTAERPARIDFPLRPGEQASVSWHNEGRWIELTENRQPLPLGKIPPYFGNGSLLFEPRRDSPAAELANMQYAVESERGAVLRPIDPGQPSAIVYRAQCPYIFADATVQGTVVGPPAGRLSLALSFDEGKSWAPVGELSPASGDFHIDLGGQVMARYAYWLKVQLAAGSEAAIASLKVRSTFIVSPLSLAGKLDLGSNRIRFAGGPVDSPIATRCRWIERYQTNLSVALNAISFYHNSGEAWRNVYVTPPDAELPVRVTLAGEPFQGRVSLENAPPDWRMDRAETTLTAAGTEPTDVAFAVRPGAVREGDVVGMSVVLDDSQGSRRVPFQVLVSRSPLVREAEAADQVTGGAEIRRAPEHSGGRVIAFDGPGELAFDLTDSPGGVHALWFRARWSPDASGELALAVDKGPPRRFTPTAMIGFTDWSDNRRAHTKMFAHFGEQYAHWAWYRLPSVQLAPGSQRIALRVQGGAELDALMLLPQNERVDRAAMNLLQNWNYAPWDNAL